MLAWPPQTVTYGGTHATLHPTAQLLASWEEPIVPDGAELAAVAFLARYSGRSLDAYRHDWVSSWKAKSTWWMVMLATAHKEFGLTQAVIEAAIDAGQLHYRVGVVHGNPG